MNAGGDRFIPRRRDLNVELARYNLNHRSKQEVRLEYLKNFDVTAQSLNFFPRDDYDDALKGAFGPWDDDIILPFRLKSGKALKNKGNDGVHWPVKARTKPSIVSPISILDLPNIQNNFCRKVVDWSQTNYITAALSEKIYLWNVLTSEMSHQIFVGESDITLQWNVTGTVLAFSHFLGGHYCSLKLWDLQRNKVTRFEKHSCNYADTCSITCMEWHPSNAFIIVGCDCGSLIVKTSDLKNVRRVVEAHHSCISRISCSPNGHYVASAGVDGCVKIRLFDTLHQIYVYYNFYPVRGLSWHPWKHSLLCFANVNSYIALCNANLGKVVHQKVIPGSSIFDVSFNKVTAELVTSHINRVDRTQPGAWYSQINVLSSFDCTVDRLVGHNGRVLYLLWDPEGSMLATAGSDEIIQLWNFLPKKYKQNKKMKHKNDARSDLNLLKYIR